MMKKSIILMLMLAMATLVCGGEENPKEKARELAMKAIKEMDADHLTESIKLLEQSCKLDPDEIAYPYEIAYAHYQNKAYKKAADILEKLIDNPKATARFYQILGNAYDLDEKPKQAIQTYDKGLKRFPNAGLLYLERGNMEMFSRKYEEALVYFEKGIKVDPGYASNYYWATRIYLSSTEKVWGMIYGEVFMNLERNSRRTAEISKLLFDTYKSQILFKEEDSYSVDFTRTSQISLPASGDPSAIKIPFEFGVYEPTLAVSIAGENSISLETLNRIRTKFLELYYEKGQQKDYPNALFAYQKKIKDAGHLEAYNHWILMKGDEDAFGQWIKKEESTFESFADWFRDHTIDINRKSHVHSSQYK